MFTLTVHMTFSKLIDDEHRYTGKKRRSKPRAYIFILIVKTL